MKHYLARLEKKTDNPFHRWLSHFYLLMLVELANRYATLHKLRTIFVSALDSNGDFPKLIVRADNPRGVVRAVELAAWAERTLPQIENGD